MSDEPMGRRVLQGMAANLASIGRRAERLRIRIVIHPDQFVVLNSESQRIVRTSVKILVKHGLAFDLLGLPRSPWATMIIHGGKAGRGQQLVEQIEKLDDSVRSRLALENDERAYGAMEIIDICRRAHVPMVFDNHHHAIKEKLTSYEDESVARMLRAAAKTWPQKAWQLVHLSNGAAAFADARHSDLIDLVPSAYRLAPWIEVEAKGKEKAIERLRQRELRSPTR